MATKSFCDNCGEEMPKSWNMYFHGEADWDEVTIVKKKEVKERKRIYFHGTYCDKCTPIKLKEIQDLIKGTEKF